MNRTDILVIWEDRALISAGVASMGTFPLGTIALLVIPIFAPIPKAYAQSSGRVRNPKPAPTEALRTARSEVRQSPPSPGNPTPSSLPLPCEGRGPGG